MRSVQSCSTTEHATPRRVGHSSSMAPACALGDLLQFAAGWLVQHSSQPVQESSIILQAAFMHCSVCCSSQTLRKSEQCAVSDMMSVPLPTVVLQSSCSAAFSMLGVR